MNIGVVGGGVVGGATARALMSFVDTVRVYDRVPERRTSLLYEVLECDLIFICLPTPQKEGCLACDTSYVEQFFETAPKDRCYVLRSTVPVGTTRRLFDSGLVNIVHSPEFLTARTADEDARNPARNVVGYPSGNDRTWSLDEHWLCSLYRRVWPHVPLYRMSSDESETVKLMQNAFSAIKIATFNEFRSLADAEGMGWDRMLGVLLAGGWINPMHTSVPGPDGKRGFGGACLPKDLANFIACLRERNLPDNMSFGAYTRNKGDRD